MPHDAGWTVSKLLPPDSRSDDPCCRLVADTDVRSGVTQERGNLESPKSPPMLHPKFDLSPKSSSSHSRSTDHSGKRHKKKKKSKRTSTLPRPSADEASKECLRSELGSAELSPGSPLRFPPIPGTGTPPLK
ncbi:hypothetical protein NDU88_006618 [Pleurodeles waltl]|uniref:Uncharacterized protein n=1 Tax=Pleurodeles waltl TaxID=8319 RepID=A0AAV7SPZ8_PLEWA|nr:hypothetical protein NDU88_006618 [Pleurodeles waltl]